MLNKKSERSKRNKRNKRNDNADAKLRRTMAARKKKSAAKRFVSVFLVLTIVTAAFLLLANRYIFKVEQIDITGNGKYSYDEVLDASGVSEGMELYSLDLGEIKRGITDRLAYVDSVKIMRIPPSTVKINIATVDGAFGIKLSGDYYILSEDFKVLEKISASDTDAENFEKAVIDKMREDHIINFTAAAIKKCYVGEYAVFGDEDISKFLTAVLDAAKEHQIADFIYEINVINKFDVRINYGNRFSVELGSFEHAETKLADALVIINQLQETARGMIYLTDAENSRKWAYTPDEKIFD